MEDLDKITSTLKERLHVTSHTSDAGDHDDTPLTDTYQTVYSSQVPDQHQYLDDSYQHQQQQSFSHLCALLTATAHGDDVNDDVNDDDE